MIAGGAEIYKLILTKFPGMVRTVHMSVMKEEFECDTFFDMNWLSNYTITDVEHHDDFVHYTLTYGRSEERQYLDLIHKITQRGSIRNTRNGNTLSIFNNNFTFDLRKGFPLLTTKKKCSYVAFWKSSSFS